MCDKRCRILWPGHRVTAVIFTMVSWKRMTETWWLPRGVDHGLFQGSEGLVFETGFRDMAAGGRRCIIPARLECGRLDPEGGLEVLQSATGATRDL